MRYAAVVAANARSTDQTRQMTLYIIMASSTSNTNGMQPRLCRSKLVQTAGTQARGAWPPSRPALKLLGFQQNRKRISKDWQVQSAPQGGACARRNGRACGSLVCSSPLRKEGPAIPFLHRPVQVRAGIQNRTIPSVSSYCRSLTLLDQLLHVQN